MPSSTVKRTTFASPRWKRMRSASRSGAVSEPWIAAQGAPSFSSASRMAVSVSMNATEIAT